MEEYISSVNSSRVNFRVEKRYHEAWKGGGESKLLAIRSPCPWREWVVRELGPLVRIEIPSPCLSPTIFSENAIFITKCLMATFHLFISQISKSNSHDVTLVDVSRKMTGMYKCEVMSGKPLYHAQIKKARMEVVGELVGRELKTFQPRVDKSSSPSVAESREDPL